MSAKIIVLIVFVGIMAAIYGMVAQGYDLTSEPATTSTLDPSIDTIMTYIHGWQESPLGQITNINGHMNYFKSILDITVMKHSRNAIFPEDSQWMWGWIVLWTPIIALVIFGIIVLFIGIIYRFISG